MAVLRTTLGVNHDGQAIQPNVWTACVAIGRSRSMVTEHTYRLAMVFVGGALWPLRCLQAALGYGDEAIYLSREPPADSVP